jgi:hypothetical protein
MTSAPIFGGVLDGDLNFEVVDLGIEQFGEHPHSRPMRAFAKVFAVTGIR